MPNPYFLVAALVGLIAAGYFSYSAGESAAEGRYAIAERVAQKKFDDALAAANLKLRGEEQAHVDDSAKSSAEYQKLKKEKDDAAKNSIAAVSDGTRKLYVLTKCPAATGNGAVPQAAPDTSGTDHPVRVELPPALGASVLAIGAEADTVADLYRRCQVELANDRK